MHEDSDNSYNILNVGLLVDSKKLDVVSVSMGKAHAVLLTRQGEVFTFGLNNKGQCGRDGISVPQQQQQQPSPQLSQQQQQLSQQQLQQQQQKLQQLFQQSFNQHELSTEQQKLEPEQKKINLTYETFNLNTGIANSETICI
ncbi:hypothetical protein HELRODRAFT_162458 [Helobdella robusta]|uniref:Uncharacterized protein n=1 Tax=Helobdella robusta TaxID=6412 RepID=T1ESP5_HELRO|nr:hypothetical protein HELRODRAFT_162458 [Helobdella robusta]ESN98984.1 hypothetical protein HELRODRAFT_162458 [Helobdella robusta]